MKKMIDGEVNLHDGWGEISCLDMVAHVVYVVWPNNRENGASRWRLGVLPSGDNTWQCRRDHRGPGARLQPRPGQTPVVEILYIR